MVARRSRVLALVAAACVLVGATACEPEPVVTQPGTVRTVLYGDSIPSWLIRDGGSAAATAAKVTLLDGTLSACEGVEGNAPARSVTGATVATPAECVGGWPALYPKPLSGERPGLAIVMSGTHAMLDHQLDGVWRHPCGAVATSWYQTDLTNRLNYLELKADKVVLVLPAWPTALSQWIMPSDYVRRADCVRAQGKAAAAAAGAKVIDLGTYLCPSGATSCNAWRSKDGVHVDPTRAATVLTWVLTAAKGA